MHQPVEIVSMTVLVVDDEPLVLESLLLLLSSHCDVCGAASAAEALAEIRSRRFDVVLCDYELGPGPNGMAVLAAARDRDPETRRVLHTAHRHLVALPPAQHVLTKPSMPRELLAALGITSPRRGP